MVIVQFIISVFLIAGTLLIYRQIDYINNKDLGIDNKNLAVIALRNRLMTQNYSSLKAEMEKFLRDRMDQVIRRYAKHSYG